MNTQELRAILLLRKATLIKQFHRYLVLPNSNELNKLSEQTSKYKKAVRDLKEIDEDAEFFLG